MGRSGRARRSRGAAVLLLLALTLPGGACSTEESATAGDTLVLVTLERSRLAGDAQAAWLDELAGELAGEALVRDEIRDAGAPAAAALATIHTGAGPGQHGLWSAGTPGFHRLDRPGTELPTLAWSWKEAGAETAAVVSRRRLSARLSGLALGFDAYRDEDLPLDGRPLAPHLLLERSREALEGGSPDAPFFLWVHLPEPEETPLDLSRGELGILRGRLAPFATGGAHAASAERLAAELADLLAPAPSDLVEREDVARRLARSVGRRRGTPAWEAWRTANERIGLDRVRNWLRELQAAALARGGRTRFVVTAARGVEPVAVEFVAGGELQPDTEPGEPSHAEGPFRRPTCRVPLLVTDSAWSAADAVELGPLRALPGRIEDAAELLRAPLARDLPVRASYRERSDWQTPRHVARVDPPADERRPLRVALEAFEPVLLEEDGTPTRRRVLEVGTDAAVPESPGLLTTRTSELRPALHLRLSHPGDVDPADVRFLPQAWPRIPAARAAAWPDPEEGDPYAGGRDRAAPRVDVTRAGAGWLEVAVPEEARQVVLRLAATGELEEPLELEAPDGAAAGFERLSPALLPGCALLVGPGPLRVRVRPGSGHRLALHVIVDGASVPDDAVRFLGRELFEDSVDLYLPPFLPESSEWFATPEAPPPQGNMMLSRYTPSVRL